MFVLDSHKIIKIKDVITHTQKYNLLFSLIINNRLFVSVHTIIDVVNCLISVMTHLRTHILAVFKFKRAREFNINI